MISCTEFIPLYSEFFKFLEKKGGHDAVLTYWHYISDRSLGNKTNPNSLISFIERDPDGPFEGALKYWDHTLTEEACDVIKIKDFGKKRCFTHMRHCPSRGRLNDMQHIEPYYDYCGHCNVIYQRVLEKYGVVFKMDHARIANAECTSMLYMAGDEPDDSIREIDGSKVVVDMKSEDNKYLHRDFHLSGNNALRYCGENFGDGAVINFLTDFTKCYYAPVIEKIKKEGLSAIQAWIEQTYEIEEASECLHTELSGDKLTVTIDKCPVIAYMRSLNQEPSKYYIEQTRTVYGTAAAECGYDFTLLYYTEDGSAQFTFSKRG